jgi:hypothetical protein
MAVLLAFSAACGGIERGVMTGPYLPPEDASEAAAMVYGGTTADGSPCGSLPSETCAGGCVARGGECVGYGSACTGLRQVGLQQICGVLYCCLPLPPMVPPPATDLDAGANGASDSSTDAGED